MVSNSNVLYFQPYLLKISNLTILYDIFQMGWSHQHIYHLVNSEVLCIIWNIFPRHGAWKFHSSLCILWKSRGHWLDRNTDGDLRVVVFCWTLGSVGWKIVKHVPQNAGREAPGVYGLSQLIIVLLILPSLKLSTWNKGIGRWGLPKEEGLLAGANC